MLKIIKRTKKLKKCKRRETKNYKQKNGGKSRTKIIKNLQKKWLKIKQIQKSGGKQVKFLKRKPSKNEGKNN